MSKSAKPSSPPVGIDRRRFLEYLGAGATLVATGGSLGSLWSCVPRRPAVAGAGWVDAKGKPTWMPPPYPVPMPGDPNPERDAERFARYEVRDELVVPEGWRVDVLVQAGERLGPDDAPEHQIDFGYNNDYTGLMPIAGRDGEYWLMVNHEYLALRPWLASEVEDGRAVPDFILVADRREPLIHKYGILTLDGFSFDSLGGTGIDFANDEHLEAVPDSVLETIRDLSDRSLAIQGVSILRLRRDASGRLSVIRDARDHKRIAAQSTQNIPLDADGNPPFAFTGPAAALLGRPRGTFCNCSGGTAPWGTFFTCEENFHYQADEEIAPNGDLLESRQAWRVRPVRINGVVIDTVPEPWTINGTGYGATRPLDGREYGWVCEIDPETGAMKKHTALGRFHHENVTIRAEAGKRLAAYMGDDRRGGHVWKFVSDGVVDDPRDPATSALLEKGTLHVARFEEGFTGRWIPLTPETPLRRPEPEHTPTGHVNVPSRFRGGFVAVGDTARDHPALEIDDWIVIVERFTGKAFADCTLGDLVRPEPSGDPAEDRERAIGILLMDAFAMANAIGGTPTARPEDLEVHPLDQSVYIAFTDADHSSDGSPDARIFPDSGLDTSRQYGAIYRLLEADADPASDTFSWGKLVSAGEVAEGGGGFANADNLFFDPAANLWMVTDITTSSQNFPTRRDATDGTQPGGKQFPGVFGNCAMFMVPTRGPDMGIPSLFAIGPIESELTGPTFTEDGRTLIVSVQHPGEENGTRSAAQPTVTEPFLIVGRDGETFEQIRTVPLGSNFPSGELGRAPRPAVVTIRREA